MDVVAFECVAVDAAAAATGAPAWPWMGGGRSTRTAAGGTRREFRGTLVDWALAARAGNAAAASASVLGAEGRETGTAAEWAACID